MKKKLQKLISVSLCVAMLGSNLSMSVSAEEIQIEQSTEVYEHEGHIHETELADVLQILEEAAPKLSADSGTNTEPEPALKPEEGAETKTSEEPETAAIQEATAEPETAVIQEATAEPETAAMQEATAEPETAAMQEATAEPETAAIQETTAEPGADTAAGSLAEAAQGEYEETEENSGNAQELNQTEAPAETQSAVDSEEVLDQTPGDEANADTVTDAGESAEPDMIVETIEILKPVVGLMSELPEEQDEKMPELFSMADNTVPVITIDPDGQTYYCTAPKVTVTDAGGDLVSIVAESSSETITGTITDAGTQGTVTLKDRMGSVTITAEDSAGHVAVRSIYDDHSIQSLRRTDLPATCTEPERRTSHFVCGICGKEYGHSVSIRMIPDPDHPGQYKEKTPAKGHDYKNSPEKIFNVCGVGSVTLQECKTCGEMIDKDTGKIYELKTDEGHQWSGIIEKKPTCTESGYRYQECNKCHLKKITETCFDTEEDGKTLTETAKSLRPLGHQIGEWMVSEGYTVSCTDKYQQERKCTREGCTLKETRMMSPGNHSWGTKLEVIKDATCTEAGKMGYKCQKCGAAKETQDIPAKGHTMETTEDCTKGGNCSVCGAQISGNQGHVWSKTLQKDSTGHWKTCSVNGCKGRTEVTPHSNSSAAYDCTKNWSCSECGYSMQGNAKHSTKWVSDEEGTCHWLECTNKGCTYKGNKTAHYYGIASEYDCTKGLICQTCGYEKLAPKDSHDYIWVNTYSNVHWMKCQNESCTKRTRYGDENYGDHVYSSERDCTKGILCTLCGYQRLAPATDHNYSGTIYSDAEGHYQLCRNFNCSVKKRLDGHTGGKATCTQQAICETCHQPYGELDLTNHPDTIIVDEKEATTEAAGHTGKTVCKECGETLDEGEEIPQLPKECEHVYERKSDAEKCWDRCKECGHEKDIVFHTFKDVITAEGHQKQCISCQYTTTLLAHVPSGEDYNCTTSLNCKDCGYVITPASEHKFGSTYAVDSSGHWQECDNPNCNQISPVQAHTAQEDDGNCTTDVLCKYCGYVMFAKAEDHRYSGTWESDENGHYQKCVNSGCTGIKREEHNWAQDDKDCTTPVVCTVCNYTKTPGESSHSFGGAYITDADGHWQKCQNAGCEAISGENEHTGGTASCRKQAVCEICGQEYGALNTENHAGDTELRNYKAPTTEAEGFSGDLYCLGCGKMLKPGVILNKLPEGHMHSYDLPKSDGTHHWKECTCGARSEFEAHNFGQWLSDSTHHWHVCSGCEATEGRGSHTYENGVCKVCGFKQEVHEHVYEWKSDENGHEQKCVTCGETANASEHIYEWCTGETEHWQLCTACGHIANKSEHKLEMQKDRTYHWMACTQEGCSYQEEKSVHDIEDDHNCTTAVKCKTCDEIVVAAKEHNWSPVYTFDGENHWHECMNEDCSQKDTSAPHTLVGDSADCTKDISCSDCGYIARKGVAEHNFDGSPYFSDKDQAGHWRVCQNEDCKVAETPEIHKGGKATCSRQAECEICHTAYGTFDPEQHEGAVEVKNEKAATTEEPGYTGDKVCTGCNAVLEPGEEIPQLEKECTHTDESGESLYQTYRDDMQSWQQCTKCGAIDESSRMPHVYNGYEHDENGHWQVCATCGYSTKENGGNVQQHRAEYDHDCSTPVVCTACGYTMTAAKEHVFGGAYVSGKSGHWQVCQNEDCNVASELSAHVISEKGDCTLAEVCEDCGYTVATAMIGHNYDTVWKAEADGSGHSQACLNMGCQKKRTEKHNPNTDDQLCTTPIVCKTCGAVTTEAKEHKFDGSEYISDETGHWRTCQNEGCTFVSAQEPHVDAKAATCVSSTYCAVCHKVYGSVDPQNHADKTGVLIRYKEATELQEGYTGDLVCNSCKAVLKMGTTIAKCPPSHKHAYNIRVSDSEYHWMECSCGVRDNSSVAPHSYGSAWETDDKEHWHICSGCGSAARNPHTFNKEGECTVCGKRNHEHQGGKATCKDPAFCDICGTPYGSKSDTHTWGEWKTTLEPTALKAGSSQRTCSICGTAETAKLKKLSPTMKVNAKKVPLKVGQITTKLKVSGLAAGDYVKSWKSSDKKIVTVSKKGKIHAKKAGKATITITLASGKKKQIAIVVKKTVVKTTKISVKSKNISLKKNMSYDLETSVKPITSPQKLTYTSLNKKIVTVSKKGVITARKPGKAKIIVKSGKKKVVVKVTVKK